MPGVTRTGILVKLSGMMWNSPCWHRRISSWWRGFICCWNPFSGESGHWKCRCHYHGSWRQGRNFSFWCWCHSPAQKCLSNGFLCGKQDWQIWRGDAAGSMIFLSLGLTIFILFQESMDSGWTILWMILQQIFLKILKKMIQDEGDKPIKIAVVGRPNVSHR